MGLSHIDEDGSIRMVDVGPKDITPRTATARGVIRMTPATFNAITKDNLPKGNVCAAARVAADFAAKKTSEVIPLCHPLPISAVEISFSLNQDKSEIGVEATVKATDRTGVEMEALHSVSIALLTIYDMAKSMDKGMLISDIRLIHKDGGKSGEYRHD